MTIPPISPSSSEFEPKDATEHNTISIISIVKTQETISGLELLLDAASILERQTIKQLREKSLDPYDRALLSSAFEQLGHLAAELEKKLSPNSKLTRILALLNKIDIEKLSQADLAKIQNIKSELLQLISRSLEQKKLSEEFAAKLLAGELISSQSLQQVYQELLKQFLATMRKQLNIIHACDPEDQVTQELLKTLNRLNEKKELHLADSKDLASVVNKLLKQYQKKDTFGQINEKNARQFIENLIHMFSEMHPIIEESKKEEQLEMLASVVSHEMSQATLSLEGKKKLQSLEKLVTTGHPLFIQLQALEKNPQLKKLITPLLERIQKEFSHDLISSMHVFLEKLRKSFIHESYEMTIDAKTMTHHLDDTKKALNHAINQTGSKEHLIELIKNKDPSMSVEDQKTLTSFLHTLQEQIHRFHQVASNLLDHLKTFKVSSYPKPGSVTAVITDHEGKNLSLTSPQITQVHKNITQVSAVHHNMTQAVSHSSGRSGNNQSLADAFRNLVLDQYMRDQQKYLLKLALALQSSNIAMDDLGSVMNILSDLSSGSVSFNVSTLINSEKKYPYGPSISNAYNSERTKIMNMFGPNGSIKQAISKIQQEIYDIEHGTTGSKMTPEAKTSLLKTLKKAEGELKEWENFGKQSQMYNWYKSHGMTSGGSWTVNGKTITSSKTAAEITKELSKYEGFLKNGGPGGVIPKLSSIYTQLSTAQSNYKNQSEQEQTTLQMKMTEIQQEWAVVATALQMLNQMYMTYANAIYK